MSRRKIITVMIVLSLLALGAWAQNSSPTPAKLRLTNH
jgi:hypothetical protein